VCVDRLLNGVERGENVGGGCGREHHFWLLKLPPPLPHLQQDTARRQQRGYFPSRNCRTSSSNSATRASAARRA
jgi:hypothetical protein